MEKGDFLKTKKCLCDEPLCGKCLGVNCQDEDCKVHIKKRKEEYRERIARNKATHKGLSTG